MEKLNIAEILKDCPKGMELDCTICDNVYLDEVTPNMIKCFIKNNAYNTIYFNHDGTYLTAQNAKCVIFPKGKATWEGFQRPFKDGDIAVTEKGHIHLLRTKDSSYCAYRGDWKGLPKYDSTITTGVKVIRFATEEEKQKLFDAIKENGYRWNPETKTLEKLIVPKFKVGDRIKNKASKWTYKVADIKENEYIVNLYGKAFNLNSVYHLGFCNEDDYELVPNKFDITTLKPFDKVLVRHSDTDYWKPAFWAKHITNQCSPFISSYGFTAQAIPFKGNEWLVGTTDDCNTYYKTWE